MSTCDRPGCRRTPAEDFLYCSDACYRLDNDDLMISPVGRLGNGFVENGQAGTRGRPTPLTARRVNSAVLPRTHLYRADGFPYCADCYLPGDAAVHHLPTPAITELETTP